MTTGRSLRTRLLTVVLATGAVVLLSSGVALYFLVRANLLQELDSALGQQARVMTSVFEWKDGRVDLELGKMAEAQQATTDSPYYFEVWQEDMGMLAKSPSLGNLHVPRPKGVFTAPKITFARLSNGLRVRLLAVTVRPRREDVNQKPAQTDMNTVPQVTLLLAGGLGRFENFLSQLALLLATVGLLAILATVGGAWWAVGFGLRPMRALAQRIGSLGEDDLGRRVDIPSAPSELLSVVERLNQLLSRLEEAFSREKALLSNLAHELRTPLAGLSFTLEVSLSRPRDAASYMADMQECLAIARNMQGMVDNLLTMARLDAGQGRIKASQTSDLEQALLQAWGPLAEKARHKGLVLGWNVEPGLTCLAEPHGLAMILRNLLANAVDYANAEGKIFLGAQTAQGLTVLRVANSGCKLQPQKVEQVFERFWRGDESRGGDDAHAGLGLALSRQLAESMKGRLRAECDRQGIFTIILELPSSLEAEAP